MKIIFNKRMFLIPLLFFIVFSFQFNTAFAVWDGNPYDPGETNNPECLPSQTNCDVLPALTSEIDPLAIRLNQSSPQTFTAGTVTGSGILKVVSGTLGLDTNTYLTSYTETDPIFSASSAYGISGTNISNWNTVYGWGNHATAGYLTSLSGTLLATGATTGATSQAQTFTNGVITGKIYPSADSTSSFGIFKADGTTNIFDVDTTNGRVGIGDTSPDQLLEILSSGAALTQFSIGNTNASDYDPQIGFELADGTNIFTMGVDDSDSDKFKISTTALGTNDRLTIDSSGALRFNSYGAGSITGTPTYVLNVDTNGNIIESALTGTVNSGSQYKATYYPNTGTIVDDWTGVNFGQTNLNTQIVAQSSTEVPLEIKLASSQSANAFNLSSSSGTGNLFAVNASGEFLFGGNSDLGDYDMQLNKGLWVSNVTGSDTGLFLSQNTTTTSGFRIFNNSTTNWQLASLNNTSIELYTSGTGYVRFMPNTAEIGRFTSSGLLISNVGATPARYLQVTNNDASNSAITYTGRFTHTTSGTPATGIGTGIEFEAETSNSNNEIGAIIDTVTTDVTGASEDFDLVFKLMAAGVAAAEKFRIASTGAITMSALTVASSSQDALCIVNGGTEVQRNNGAQTCTVSSARFKHDINSLENGALNTILELKPSSFVYNGQDNERIGLIAEEVEKIEPRLVFYETDGVTPRGVRYEDLTALSVKAIQELDLKINDIENIEQPNNFFGSKLKSWLGSVTNEISDIFSDHIHVRNTLCIGETCINEEQLKTLLQNVSDSNNNSSLQAPASIDVCPNIDGNQEKIPTDYYSDFNNNCVVSETIPQSDIISDSVLDSNPSLNTEPEAIVDPNPI